jgi:hypothetical protein
MRWWRNVSVYLFFKMTAVSSLLTSPILDQMIAAWESGQISSASPPDVSEFEQNLRVSFNRWGMFGYADHKIGLVGNASRTSLFVRTQHRVPCITAREWCRCRKLVFCLHARFGRMHRSRPARGKCPRASPEPKR